METRYIEFRWVDEPDHWRKFTPIRTDSDPEKQLQEMREAFAADRAAQPDRHIPDAIFRLQLLGKLVA
jgi:hypothetical protein